MQLIVLTLLMTFLFFVQEVKAQVKAEDDKQTDSSARQWINPKVFEQLHFRPVDLSILSSYYQQDGNNAAVTGGLGSEYLDAFVQKIIVTAPLNDQIKLKLDGGYDYYSSVSTDQIDNIASSASSSDTRSHANIGIIHSVNAQNQYGVSVGGSTEFDYQSLHVGGSYQFSSANKNSIINLSGSAYFDTWDRIYPAELRELVQLDQDKRQAYNFGVSLNQVVNRRMQIQLSAEVNAMSGLLSTPFHRVYFQDVAQGTIEQLPSFKLKVPLSARLNYYLSDRLILRTSYRYYWDDWGLTGHTASIEMPVKINRFMAIYPHYRYHSQTGIDYFNPFKEHLTSQRYFTSDHDLAPLNSHSYGLGFKWNPAGGVARLAKHRLIGEFRISALSLKYTHYRRSTGLTSDMISFGIGFSLVDE